MGLFGKKGKEIPDLPPAPRLPDLPRGSEALGVPEIALKEEGESGVAHADVHDRLGRGGDELHDLPRIEGMKPKSRELPTLPTTNFGEDLNNEMVKSAVDDFEHGSYEGGGVEMQELPKNFKLEEKGRIPSPPMKSLSRSDFVGDAKKRTLELARDQKVEPVVTKPNEPIFVRIDKFQKAQKDFESIKKKIKDIESTLKKFNEIKFKEDTEVSSWNQNLEKIKARLDSIEKQIFDKV